MPGKVFDGVKQNMTSGRFNSPGRFIESLSGIAAHCLYIFGEGMRSLLQAWSPQPHLSELYLKVVFKGKGGVSTGRLLAAVNRPH